MAFFCQISRSPETDSHPCIRKGGPVDCIGGPVKVIPKIIGIFWSPFSGHQTCRFPESIVLDKHHWECTELMTFLFKEFFPLDSFQTVSICFFYECWSIGDLRGEQHREFQFFRAHQGCHTLALTFSFIGSYFCSSWHWSVDQWH